jgi:large repetitive protein
MKTHFRKHRLFAITLAALVPGLSFIRAVQAASWSTNASLVSRRVQHTATLLSDGKVLIAGGWGNVASAELCDPATCTSVPTGAMNTGRCDHAAVLLSNGKVLVAGGYNYDYAGPESWLASAELYDPATGTWTLTGSLHTPRALHEMTLLPNGKVLAVGGTYLLGGSLGSAELYDPDAGVWTVTGTLSLSRCGHALILLPSGKVLAAGGMRGTLPPPWAETPTAELYDPDAGTWSMTGSLNVSRAGHSAVLLPGGKVLAVGGVSSYTNISSVELYDSASETWTLVNPMQLARGGHTATLLPGGKVLIVGGADANHADLASTELYNPDTGTWTTSAAMHLARSAHAATLLTNATLLVTGGCAGGWATNSTEIFDFLSVPIPTTTTLTGATNPGDGSFQFTFTNTPGASFVVLAATNVALPLNHWTLLDGVMEIHAGRFQFTDPQAMNSPRQFYRLRSP